MLKGLFSGLIWGILTSVVLSGAASLNAPLPGPTAQDVRVALGSGFDAPPEPRPLELTARLDEDAPALSSRVPVPELPLPNLNGADLPVADLNVPDLPAPTLPAPTLPDGIPEEPQGAQADVAQSDDTNTNTNTNTEVESEVTEGAGDDTAERSQLSGIAAEIAADGEPDVDTSDSAESSDPAAADPVENGLELALNIPEAQPTTRPAPAAGSDPSVPDQTEQREPETVGSTENEAVTEDQATPDPASDAVAPLTEDGLEDDPAAPTPPDTSAVTPPVSAQDAPAEPAITAPTIAPDANTTETSLDPATAQSADAPADALAADDTPQPPPPDPDAAITTGRLPTIAAPETVTPQTAATGSVQPDAASPSALGRAALTPVTDGALARNALTLNFPDDAPLFSIVLVDRTGNGLPLAEIASLPVPVTVALSSLTDGAEAAAEGYRATGHEVLVLAENLPTEGNAADLALALSSQLSKLPSAVGVLIPNDSPLLRDRTRLDQIAAILARTGHGLVAPISGLDSASQAAAAAGVPSAPVFRILDGQEEGVPLMERYLDRAAFQAARESSVVVMGTATADTLEALLNWVGGRRAGTVSIAPVSAVMLRE